MTDTERKKAAKEFADKWEGYEKGETQKFWIELLGDVLGAEHATQRLDFEVPIQIEGSTKFADAYIPETGVLIEQKSADVDLTKGQRQSDGALLTPFQQARRYNAYLPYNRRPRWIVVSNFREIHVHDMNRPNDAPEVIRVADLPQEMYRLQFLIAKRDALIQKETELSIEAGAIVAGLYKELSSLYVDPDSPASMESLNMLCVRIVFCMYAEDADVFEKKQFHDYVAHYDAEDVGEALTKLFHVLDTPEDKRSPYLKPILAAFPYANGGLFRNEDIEIPLFNDLARSGVLTASATFDWSQISPTIFGAIFESTMNPETKHAGGMHYTSVENIHKVIDPLFLDDLKDELGEILETPVTSRKNDKTRNRLLAFQNKLSKLVFLDPACGSGNFLTETYLSLRRLENTALEAIYSRQQVMGEAIQPIKVHISQFHGIEINDFAVSVVQTALWIAENQMMRETEAIVKQTLDFLPLTTAAHIVEGNALRLDWNDVVPKHEVSYIMGNPPFLGARYASKAQKADMQAVFAGTIKTAQLDYVTAWFKKAAEFIVGTRIEVAFVSTNSITQGQMVSDLWSMLFREYHPIISFAWQTFVWDSESTQKAHVHVVIIGFAAFSRPKKMLFADQRQKAVSSISPYLMEGQETLVVKRRKPLCDVPGIIRGNQPTDGGNLILEADEYEELMRREPNARPFVKRFMMGYEFINNKDRWCLWLVDCSPAQLKAMPFVRERVKKVQAFRKASSDNGTQRMAETPTLFREQRNPDSALVVPVVSSEQRRYIPIGFIDKDTIAGNKLYVIIDAGMYHFGILTSNLHNAWMRTVGGRLKSDYTYSKDIVYNNFPWPDPTPKQRAEIEKTAQAILDARAKHPDCSLADLYDPGNMPGDLLKAHQDNDRAVMKAYGLKIRGTTEADAVSHLMRMYEKLSGSEE